MRDGAARLVMNLHDELLFEVPEERLAEMAAIVRRHFEASELSDAGEVVPLVANLSYGPCWGEMEEYER